MLKRPRRNRKHESIRSLVQEHYLMPQDLVVPFFIIEGSQQKEAIPLMPQIFKMSADVALKEAEALHKKGIQSIALFPVYGPGWKDESGSLALDSSGIIPQTLALFKKEIPSLCLIADVALDPYTSHGHDGIVGPDQQVLNDETVDMLAKAAVLYAQYGADFLAPSDMMDGRVQKIRTLLDQHGLTQAGIISYTAKYASSLYGPFRDTIGSTLQFGDKKSYQMNPANIREALLEASLDEAEGADALMVKPAGFYLDVIAKMKERTNLPICAYQVSGEYAMIRAGEEKGFLDANRVFYESLLSIKRAGADFIFTYAAPFILDRL
ncbi:MAG: porphobilinogen synthase [Chlamydiia bacterium]